MDSAFLLFASVLRSCGFRIASAMHVQVYVMEIACCEVCCRESWQLPFCSRYAGKHACHGNDISWKFLLKSGPALEINLPRLFASLPLLFSRGPRPHRSFRFLTARPRARSVTCPRVYCCVSMLLPCCFRYANKVHSWRTWQNLSRAKL